MEGSSWDEVSDFFSSFVASGPADGSAKSAAVASSCKGGAVGPPLDYKAAVKRYLTLPWSMRRKGARHEGGSLIPVRDSNYTCFKGPYAQGGPLDKPCALEDHIYYPSAPSQPKALAGVPDISRQKLARCTSFKRNIRAQPREHTRRADGPNISVQPFFGNANITCSAEQLCFYPPERPPLEGGGFVEAVNTELGVEVSTRE
jgi:hypothetical protein